MTPDGKFTIAFSNSIQAAKWGGGEKWVVTTAQGLAERGHHVIVAGKKNSAFIRQAKTANLETVLFNIHADFQPLKVLTIQKFLQAQAIDVIVLNLNKDIRVAGWAAQRAMVPVILARNGFNLISDRLRHRLTISLVDGIITNTNSIKEAYKSIPWLPESKVKVIYNGVKIPVKVESIDLHQQYGIPEDHVVLIAIGRLAREKGFDLLISAMARIKAAGLLCTILLVGDGNLRSQLEAMIHTSGAADRVRLTGFIEDPLPLIKSADYLILTSRHEGMPNVILEAMALGTPVLSTAVNGTTELVEHMESGYLFEAASRAAIVEAVRFAYDHHRTDLPKRLRETARNLVRQRFSFPRMIDQLEEYFHEKYVHSPRR